MNAEEFLVLSKEDISFLLKLKERKKLVPDPLGRLCSDYELLVYVGRAIWDYLEAVEKLEGVKE